MIIFEALLTTFGEHHFLRQQGGSENWSKIKHPHLSLTMVVLSVKHYVALIYPRIG
jgi:hypothetical protein